MRRIAAIASVAGLLSLAAGAAASPAAAATRTNHAPSVSSSQQVNIVFFAFHPNDFTVRPGAALKVVNVDWKTIHEPHTFTAQNGSFNTGVVTGTPATVFAPPKPGRYLFVCEIHFGMYGWLTVAKP
jgi:plastocyanin